jgi:hypothetical protein
MKYLYVLVSIETDLYYEQALLSITSLRRLMPNAFVSLLVDDITKQSLQGSRKQIYQLVDEFKSISLPGELSNKERSRWLKTSMRQHISGDFLYIDCDTVIADDLQGIDTQPVDLGAVLDVHLMPKKRLKIKKQQIIINNSKKTTFISEAKKYFNSGVILCRDIPINYKFFDHWHAMWRLTASHGILEDQPAFSQANIFFNNLVKEIRGTWNCQLVRWGIPYLAKAKIIHYYSASAENKKNYVFANAFVYESIKKEGIITEQIMNLIKHPKAAFSIKNRLVFFKSKKIINLCDFLFFNFLKCFF